MNLTPFDPEATIGQKGGRMSISTWAHYQNGILKPIGALPLKENQRVQIIVLPQPQELDEVDEARLAEMHRRADEWLVQQPPDAVRPSPLSEEERRQAIAELDQVLRELREANVHYSEEEVMADVNAAVKAVRAEKMRQL
jgi:predicted DNA-binding antitoxin AbrB/MazE fold protein